MASELARQILDAGFPAAKPVRDHDLFGIPTLEELIAAVEQLRPEVRLSVRRINPDEWEAHSGFVTIDGEVTYWARHGSTATEAIGKALACPSRGTIGSGQLSFEPCRTISNAVPHRQSHRSRAVVQPLQAQRIAQNQTLLRYQAAPVLMLLLTTPFSRCTAKTSSACSASRTCW